jgi:hypothetical protein
MAIIALATGEHRSLAHYGNATWIAWKSPACPSTTLPWFANSNPAINVEDQSRPLLQHARAVVQTKYHSKRQFLNLTQHRFHGLPKKSLSRSKEQHDSGGSCSDVCCGDTRKLE